VIILNVKELVKAIFILGICVIYSSPSFAEKPEEMNLRSHMDPKIRNKISNARLRGMLARERVETEYQDVIGNGKGGKDSPCSTNIGNHSLNNIGSPTRQDIIILGDIINLCNR